MVLPNENEVQSTAVINIAPSKDLDVQSLTTEILRLRDFSKTLQVATKEDVAAATNDLSIMANLKKAVIAKHREYKEPIEAYLKPINEVFKMLISFVDEATGNYKNKVLAYHAEIDRKAREAAEIARMEAEAATRKAVLEGKEAPAPIEPLPAPTPAAPVRAEAGTSNIMYTWKYRVIDMALVPDAYKIIDAAQLNTIARSHHDTKPIPGIEFYKESTLRVEAKK
jgi:hypothetical protein